MLKIIALNRTRIGKFFGLGFCLFLLGAGCATVPSVFPTINPPTVESLESSTAWTAYGSGIEKRTFALAASSTVSLTLFRFDPTQITGRLAVTSTRQSLTTWLRTNNDARLIVNGVYFHEDNSPSGLVIQQGQRVGRRQFDEQRSGVLEFAPEQRLIDTTAEAALYPSYVEAAQSYPFLVKNGQPVVESESGRRARRTFVGTDKTGRWYVGIVSEQEISLYQLARLLVSGTDITWDKVLNLDGGPSTGYAAQRADGTWETVESFGGVPNVLVFEARR